ncbi:MAG: hypothetical protein WCI38_01615 [Chthoniobacterales bacterium]|jgi:hypothetical protein
MMTCAFWWSVAGLWLLLVWGWQRIPLLRGPAGFIFAMAFSGVLSVVPFFGHPLRYWLSGLTPNISVPLVVMVAAAIASRGGLLRVFRAREWSAAWMFGACAAVLLYPSALGLGPRNFDSYALGWPWLFWAASLALFGLVALSASWLLWRGNRFGWVLVAAAIAYLVPVQESRNFWDYLVDPLYAVVSIVAALRLLLLRWRGR